MHCIAMSEALSSTSVISNKSDKGPPFRRVRCQIYALQGSMEKPEDVMYMQRQVYLLMIKQGVVLRLPGDNYLSSRTNHATSRHS